MSQELIAFLQKIDALKAEAKRLHPQLQQYTRGLAVTKGVTAAGLLLEQLKEQA